MEITHLKSILCQRNCPCIMLQLLVFMICKYSMHVLLVSTLKKKEGNNVMNL